MKILMLLTCLVVAGCVRSTSGDDVKKIASACDHNSGILKAQFYMFALPDVHCNDGAIFNLWDRK